MFRFHLTPFAMAVVAVVTPGCATARISSAACAEISEAEFEKAGPIYLSLKRSGLAVASTGSGVDCKGGGATVRCSLSGPASVRASSGGETEFFRLVGGSSAVVSKAEGPICRLVE